MLEHTQIELCMPVLLQTLCAVMEAIASAQFSVTCCMPHGPMLGNGSHIGHEEQECQG